MTIKDSLKLSYIGSASVSLLAFYLSVQCLKRSLNAYRLTRSQDHYQQTMGKTEAGVALALHPDHPLSRRIFHSLQDSYSRKCSAENRYIISMAAAGGLLLFGSAYIGNKFLNSVQAVTSSQHKLT